MNFINDFLPLIYFPLCFFFLQKTMKKTYKCIFHAWISWFSCDDLFLFHSCMTMMKSSSILGRSVRFWRGRNIRGPTSPSPLIDPCWAWYQWVPAGSALNLQTHTQVNNRWFEMLPHLKWVIVGMLMLYK